MPLISKEKKDKISEQILHYLFTISPESTFTNKISQEIARDEEFTKSILLELKQKNLVVEVNKNGNGRPYLKRQRWRLPSSVFEAYKQHQDNNHQYLLQKNLVQ